MLSSFSLSFGVFLYFCFLSFVFLLPFFFNFLLFICWEVEEELFLPERTSCTALVFAAFETVKFSLHPHFLLPLGVGTWQNFFLCSNLSQIITNYSVWPKLLLDQPATPAVLVISTTGFTACLKPQKYSSLLLENAYPDMGLCQNVSLGNAQVELLRSTLSDPHLSPAGLLKPTSFPVTSIICTPFSSIKILMRCCFDRATLKLLITWELQHKLYVRNSSHSVWMSVAGQALTRK